MPTVMTQKGQAFVTLGDMFVILVEETARTAEQWRWVMQPVEALVAQQPDGIFYLQLLMPTAEPPDSAMRTRMQRDLGKLAPKMRRMGTVVFGDSMRQNIVRTIMRGMLLLNGMSKQHVIAATLTGALDEMLRSAGPNTLSRAQILAGADSLFTALGAQHPAAEPRLGASP